MVNRRSPHKIFPTNLPSIINNSVEQQALAIIINVKKEQEEQLSQNLEANLAYKHTANQQNHQLLI